MRPIKNQLIQLCACFFLVVFTSAKAQQDAQFSNYMYNTSSINPAYSGSKGSTNFVGVHRKQWFNIENAPTTQTLAVDMTLQKNDRIGLGASVIYDKITPTTETNINIDFSYALRLGEKAKIRFGTKVGGRLLNVDITNLSKESENDILYKNNNFALNHKEFNEQAI